jgi:hypothetical protein
MIFKPDQMAKEEDIINKVLWRYYTDAELRGITQRIIDGLSPEILVQYNKWMIRGLSNTEIIDWLKVLKNNAPDFVFKSVMQTPEEELPTILFN